MTPHSHDTIDILMQSFPDGETVEFLMRKSLSGISIIGNDYTIEYVNNKICEILGRTQEELLGQDFNRFVHHDSSTLVNQRYTSRLRGESIPSIYEAKIIGAQGETKDVLIRTSVLVNAENRIKILAHVLDITDEKMVRQALVDSENMHRLIVETINEGLGIISDHGEITYANPALCRMLDYSAIELTNKLVSDIMQGFTFDEVFEKIRERINGRVSRYESALVHKSGRLIPVIVSASPLLGHNGEYQGSITIFTDNTKQKMVERRLRNARDRASLYLDLMGHDIRNHLQEIQVSAELLEFNRQESFDKELLKNISHAVSKSAKIISDTKSIDQLLELPLSERLLDEVLRENVEATRLLFEDAEISLSIHIVEAAVMVDDSLELLLSHLIAYTYENNPNPEKKIWIELLAGSHSYELLISDNGPGISDKVKRRIFNPHYRHGGVGLQLVHHIIEKYCGKIEVLDRVHGKSNLGPMMKVTIPKME